MGRSSCARRSQFETPQWSILDFIPEWAEKAPQRVFLAQRGRDGAWQKITYAELWQRVQSVGQAMIDLGARRGDKFAILSGNSIEHAIVMFAAMSVGRRRSSDIAELFADAGRPGSLAGYRDAASALFRFRAGQREFSGARRNSGACLRDMDCGGSEGWIGLDSVALPDPSRRGVRAAFRSVDGKQPPRSCSPRVRPGFPRA